MPTPEAILIYRSATKNSITFDHDGVGWFVPDNESIVSSGWGNWSGDELSEVRYKTDTQKVYDNASGCLTHWSWTFQGGNGGTSTDKTNTNVIISGFNIGQKNTLTGTLKATRDAKKKIIKYTQYREREKNQDGSYTPWVEQTATSNTSYESLPPVSIGTASKSLVFYTKPDEFSWGDNSPQEGKFIDDVLTADKWNDLMDKAVAKYNYNNCQPESTTSPKEPPQNYVESGDFISASIYNAGAQLCGVDNTVNSGDLIKASLFTALSNAVNS